MTYGLQKQAHSAFVAMADFAVATDELRVGPRWGLHRRKMMLTVVACSAAFAALSVEMPTGGICAHRGDRAEFPENTVPAFLSAVKKGAAMVEFDVHRCKTGELIVMHDRTIDRTTTGTGAWSALTFDELRSVDAGVKKDPKFAGTRIPTFDEAIDCFPTNGVWLNVHCGDDVTDEVALRIKAKGRLHQAFVAAGIAGVRRARAVVPEIKVCLFSAPKDSWRHSWTAEERRASIAEVRAEKAEFTQPHFADFTPDELHAYHAEGGKVNFFWCNKPHRLAALLARGIDFPLTDNLAPMVAEYGRLMKRPWSPPDPESWNYLADSAGPVGRPLPPDARHNRKSRAFGGIPSIAVSPKSGRLWATWYGGPTNGEDSNNYVILATSADGGTTWKEVLVYDPDRDGPWRSFDPEVWVAPDGRLRWTFTERKVPLRDGDLNRFSHAFTSTDDRLMMVALDADVEPSAPYPPATAIGRGVMMCKPTATRDGRWLFPNCIWADDFSARLLETRDGLCFTPVGGASLPPENREFDEHNVVELKDGRLRVYMRVQNGRGHGTWQAESADGGRTWDRSRPCPFTQTNSRIFVRRLASGALLMVKNGSLTDDPGGNYAKRVDMTAYVSDDDGETWTGGLLLKAGDCSYPDGDQGADGTIYVTFDNDRYGRQDIFLAKFTEAEVRAGGTLKNLGKVKAE